MQNKTYLKPCPFCGDTYIKLHQRDGKYTVGCNLLNCVCLHTDGRLFKREEEAINAWNKRTKTQDDIDMEDDGK